MESGDRSVIDSKGVENTVGGGNTAGGEKEGRVDEGTNVWGWLAAVGDLLLSRPAVRFFFKVGKYTDLVYFSVPSADITHI